MGSFIYLTQTVQHGDGNAFMYLAWNVNFLVVMATSAHVLQRLATRCLGNNCWCVMSMRFSWHMLMCINSVSHSQCLSLRLWKREWGAGADPGFWSGGPSGVLTPRRALSPKCAQNRFFPLKLPENCMIKKNLGAKGGGRVVPPLYWSPDGVGKTHLAQIAPSPSSPFTGDSVPK